MSNECLKSIFAIVYLYKEFELGSIIDLKEFIPEPYPVIGVEKLETKIQEYIKYKAPMQYERNIYVLQMIERYK